MNMMQDEGKVFTVHRGINKNKDITDRHMVIIITVLLSRKLFGFKDEQVVENLEYCLENNKQMMVEDEVLLLLMVKILLNKNVLSL